MKTLGFLLAAAVLWWAARDRACCPLPDTAFVGDVYTCEHGRHWHLRPPTSEMVTTIRWVQVAQNRAAELIAEALEADLDILLEDAGAGDFGDGDR